MSERRMVGIDVDGTTIDTEGSVRGGMCYSLTECGFYVPEAAVIDRIIANPLRRLYHLLLVEELKLFEEISDDLLERLISHYRRFQENYTEPHPTFPGVADTLKRWKEKDIPIAAVTSREGWSAKQLMDEAGISQYVDLIIGSSDVTLHKPEPEGLLKALEYFGSTAEESFYIGDTISDIETGQNAHMRTIAVTYGFHRGIIASSSPTHIINTFPEADPIVCG